MRDFTQLADEYQFTPVRSSRGSLAGYLHLEGKNTKAVLSSTEFHHFDDDEQGWFELELDDHRGSRVLLHNALTQSQSMPGSRAGKHAGSYTSDIFPNRVVLGAENLRRDRSLYQMSFELQGAENFFVYDTIEWRSLHGQVEKQSVLGAIRKGAWKPPKDLRSRPHANDPHDIYIVHNPKTYLDFALEDMRVRVYHSRSQRGLGWTGHEIKITPVFSVEFKEPVSIDEALDKLWRLKGFFDQLALCDLNVEAVAFSKFKKGWPSADVYLSNEVGKPVKRRLEVHPSNVPFSRWEERRSFSDCFEAWLRFSERRRFFRAAVRLSLIRLQREIDPTLITLLMAGIESLQELGGPSGISIAAIEKMTKAALQVEPSVDAAAVRGLLGVLRRTSPKQRLRKIAEGILDESAKDDVENIATACIELRNQIAHGRGLDQIERAAAGDLVRFLTFLCVAYDLHTSGFRVKGEGDSYRTLLAVSQMSRTWQGYKMATAQC